jgi:acyl dehydratase
VPLDPSFAGRVYPPTPAYEVGREKIAEFADAIGDPNPAYRDPAAARAFGHPDVVAPPTFPILLTLMRAGQQVIDDPELGIDYARVVHGEQRFAFARPVRAGDRLQVVVSIESIRTAAGNDLIRTKSEASTEDGELVVTAHALLVVRGPERDA